MGNISNLSSEIASVLEGIQQDSSSAFADVEQYPTTTFTGSPAATVAPSDIASDYATVVQDLRTYSFVVDLYYPVEDVGVGVANAFTQMSILLDTTLDAFDNCNDLNNNCQILRPTPGNWSLIETSFGTAVTARITLKCLITVNTNNG